MHHADLDGSKLSNWVLCQIYDACKCLSVPAKCCGRDGFVYDPGAGGQRGYTLCVRQNRAAFVTNK
jgi:hypothetical protein